MSTKNIEHNDNDLSPCCQAVLRYEINRDAYLCKACKKEYFVESVEKTHINYNGGPPELNQFPIHKEST